MSEGQSARTVVSMSDQVTLVEDGIDRASRGGAKRGPSWLLVTAGFVVGLGLGVLVVGSGPETTDASTQDTIAPDDPALVTDPDGLGAGEVIPDFPDALVVVSGTVGTALQHVLWPNHAPMRVLPMTSGDRVELDAGAQHVAISTAVPGLDGAVLSIGRGNDVSPVAPGVNGYVWHDTTPGSLGYTVESDGTTQLFRVDSPPMANHVVEWDEPDRTVVALGDWGWALQGADDVVLLTPEGEFRDSEVGTALASHASGWLFMIENGSPKLVSSGGGVLRIPAELEVGEPVTAEFSPDREWVAVAGQSGVVVVSTTDGSVVELSGLTTGTLAWSSDNRFVLAGTGAGVVVFDLETDEVRPVLREHVIVEVGVIPLGAP